MKKKILISLMLIVICSSMTMYSFASSVTDLQNQKNQAANNKEALEDEKEAVEAEKNEVLSKINEISSQISDSQAQLDTLNAKVKELESSIATKEKELKEAEAKQQQQEETLEKRLIAQHKTGKVSYWNLLLNPSSFLDFFSNLHTIERIAKLDAELIETIERDKEAIEKAKEELTSQRSEVKAAKAEAEKENVKLKTARAQKNSQVQKLSDQEKSLQEQIDQYDKEMRDLQAQIRAAQASNSNSGQAPVYSGGKLAWPVPSSYKINSYFGYRIHPIYHVNKLHAGIDIGGAAWEAPFVAAEDGIVIKAEYYGGYGNCVIIDHGGGITTLYGHGSAIYVTKGQRVTRGQNVLAIGSSGTSTGKHAHFEVRVNGTPVDPLPYLK